jgi:hypothetical protein
MKILLSFVFLSFGILAHADTLQSFASLKGLKSFTVYNQISPYPLYLSPTSALTEELKKMGVIVNMTSQKAFNDNFYAAMVQPVFLKLSIENSIVEVPKTLDMDKQLKVEVHLILEAIKGFSEDKKEEKAPMTLWIVDEVIDFSSDEARLLNDATDAIKKLSKKFAEAYRAANPKSENNPTFFLL